MGDDVTLENVVGIGRVSCPRLLLGSFAALERDWGDVNLHTSCVRFAFRLPLSFSALRGSCGLVNSFRGLRHETRFRLLSDWWSFSFTVFLGPYSAFSEALGCALELWCSWMQKVRNFLWRRFFKERRTLYFRFTFCNGRFDYPLRNGLEPVVLVSSKATAE